MPAPSKPSPAQDIAPAVTVFVCTTCRRAENAEEEPRAGAILAEALVRHADPATVSLRPVQCLANCRRGPSAVIACPGAWTYVFGHLAGSEDAQALLEGARLLASAPDGLMPWRGRPEPLKKGLIARIPPLMDTRVPASENAR